MDLATQVQILKEAVCILHGTNILGKGMNPSILFPAKSKYSYDKSRKKTKFKPFVDPERDELHQTIHAYDKLHE